MRSDGQDIGGDPALYEQFETDSRICQGETHRQRRTQGPIQFLENNP
jgi:hypothetical protein